jgi:cytosine deaminase
MELSSIGRISVGLNADLILFKARYFSELLSCSQSDRIILRRGKPINTNLPDYADLDKLVLVNREYNQSV